MALKRFRPISLFIGLLLPLVLNPPAQAQGVCPYAILRIESRQAVDAAAVCEAAKPWADAGYQVLVFLTDARPANEDAWFALLDGVEAEARLRDLTQDDYFEKAAIALEATTATDLPYGITLTYGEALYNTPLDTNAAALESVKRGIRESLAAQDATGALTTGLAAAADLAGISTLAPVAPNPPVPLTTPPSSAVGTSTVVADQGDSGNALAGGGLVVALGGSVGFVALRRRRKQRLQAQLATLQSRIANLLMGCEQLLAGGVAENTVSYQLFVEADGERYPELTQQVKAGLTQARQALDQAFQVHSHLQEDAAQSQRPLPAQVEAWEMLYLSFVGKRDRIRAMSDEELQTLLNPAQVLESNPGLSQGLVTQLETIQQRIKDTPLKVELMQVNPEGVDNEGILGLVEQVDATIGRLRQAVRTAPEQLAQIRQRRQALDTNFPTSLGLSAADVFWGVDQLIAAAETSLNQDRLYLQVLTHCSAATQAMDGFTPLKKVLQTHERQQADIQAVTTAGYRPPRLPQRQAAVEKVLAQLRHQLQSGDYAPALDTLPDLEKVSREALDAATDWQKHHQTNQQDLHALTTEADHLRALYQNEAGAAWDRLRAYPASNWSDLTANLDQADEILQRVQGKTLPYLYQQNDFSVQALDIVSGGITTLKPELAAVETYLQAVLDRMQLIETAAARLSHELSEVEANIHQTTKFVTEKLLGIFATSEPDQRLKEAQSQVDSARQLGRDREFLLACEARDQALRLVLFVYAAKVREVAAKARSQVMDRDAQGAGQADYDQAEQLIANDNAIRTATGTALFAQYANMGQARQALDTAEKLARQSIRRTQAARNTRSSSSSSSYSSGSSSSFGSSSRSSSSGGSSSRSSSSGGSSRRR
ncbi:hypothetical protein [Leptolyngbya sp. PCC 6406]|uniref:hypothetical protein n=1 Tax=Leptolyngbya sp. PCC 6406 TaxID=1173264 RepID=UPI0002ACBD2D|nr:hypothetical protein [Leptolyngbya sp. PCC 6406]